MIHEELVEQAKETISDVFGDNSVDKNITIDSLEELKGHIQDMLNTL